MRREVPPEPPVLARSAAAATHGAAVGVEHVHAPGAGSERVVATPARAGSPPEVPKVAVGTATPPVVVAERRPCPIAEAPPGRSIAPAKLAVAARWVHVVPG